MARYLSLLAFLVCSLRVCIAQEASDDDSFQSQVAKTAVAKFDERLRFLDQKLQEQIALAEKTLRSDLESALSEAVEGKDFAEANRISALLDSKLKAFVEKRTKTTPDTDGDKQQIAKLKEKLAELESREQSKPPIDPVVGRWDYGNGNVCDYTQEGFVVLRGKRIGLWAKVENNQYLVAFLRTFADGSSEELMLHPDGKHATSVSSKSSVQLKRIVQ